MNRSTSCWCGVVVLFVAAIDVHAQAVQNVVLRNSFSPIGAGARGVGMGGAFIAVADDGTAATFNPAGLAQLRRAELAIVGFGSELSSSVNASTFAQGNESSASHSAVDFVGLAIPFEVGTRRLTFQLAYQRAVDLFGQGRAVLVDELPLSALGVDDPGSVGVSVDVVPTQTGALHNISASAALQITDKLYLGTALNYWMGDWTASGTRDTVLFAPAPSGARASSSIRDRELSGIETQFEQAQSLRGFNLNLGFLLKHARVSIGGVLRLPFSGDYRLDELDRSVFFDPSGSSSTPELEGFGVTTSLNWPRGGGLGIAFRPFTGLTVSTDVSTTLWSRASIEQLPDGALLTDTPLDADGNAIGGFTDRNFFDLLPKTLTSTSDSSQWRIGAEYLVAFSGVVVPLRIGSFRTTSPFTDAIEGGSSTIRGLTVGTGVNFDRFVVDLAYERSESDVALGLRRLNRSEAAQNPTETVVFDRIVASVILRFDGDTFRGLFTSSDGGGSE